MYICLQNSELFSVNSIQVTIPHFSQINHEQHIA